MHTCIRYCSITVLHTVSLEGKGHLDLITFFNLCMPKIKFLFKTLKLFKIQTAFMNF